MSTNYLTADWHLNHEFVAKLRGFTNTEDHDEHVLDNAGSVLKKDADELFTGDQMHGLNVGVDWFHRPVSLEAVIDMLNMDPTHKELMYK